MDAGRTEAMAVIDRHFYAIDGRLCRLNSIHLYDLNTTLERIYCRLLNKIYGWSLCNLNDEQLNTAGIDLADKTCRVSVQLSSRAAADKVRDTLDTFFRLKLHEKYDKLYIVFMGYGYPSVTDYSANLQDNFQFTRDDHVLNHRTLYQKIDKLDTESVKAIADLLDEEMGQLHRVLDEALPNLPPISDFYINDSRAKQIAALAPLMQEADPLVIWGEGGIGKTQMALKLVGDRPPRRGAGFIKYIPNPPVGEESMFASILAADFHGGPFKDRDPDARKTEFQKRIEIFAQCGERAVLIIDDFWRHGCRKMLELTKEGSFRQLQQTNIHLILTTRFQYNNLKIPDGQPDPGHIEALDHEQLTAQVCRYCTERTLTNDEVRPLVQAAGCNTLAAYLICETLRDGSISVEELQTLLTNGSSGDLILPVFTDEYGENEGDIRDHLARLHDLSLLDDAARQTLALALLVCPGKFKSSAFTRALTDASYKRSFLQLCYSGWINLQEGIFGIAPMVRLAYRNSLMLDAGILPGFLERLCGQRDNSDLSDEDREQICTCCRTTKQLFSGCTPVCPQGQELPDNAERGR